jgi:hypothetical protein
MLEVAAARKLYELAGIAALGGPVGVAAGDRDWDDVVGIAVDEQLGQAERQPLDRRGEVVAAGAPYGRPAEQRLGRSSRQPQPRCLAEVGDSRLRDGGSRADARVGARDLGGQAAPGGGPERELSTRRVADRYDACEVERLAKATELVDPRGDVFERGRPAAAAAPPEPAVLEVPGSPAARGEIGRELVLLAQVVACSPEAAVDQDSDRKGPVALRKRQLAELVSPLTVGELARLDAAEVSPALRGDRAAARISRRHLRLCRPCRPRAGPGSRLLGTCSCERWRR